MGKTNGKKDWKQKLVGTVLPGLVKNVRTTNRATDIFNPKTSHNKKVND